MLAGALALVAAVGAGALWTRQKAQRPQPAAERSPLIVPTGDPADWTDVSTVLAEVPDRIPCTRLLADQRTIRFVWGAPPRAEDIDIVTRKRVQSPIVPAAYAQGCPDLSSDGKRLVYQGRTPDGRAFAFLSQRPDGKDAVPVVPTAEPTMSSEPRWLADGQNVSYDVDSKHMGVFSSVAGRAYVLPETTAHAFVTMFRFVSGNRILVATVDHTGAMEVTGFLIPQLKEEFRFRVPFQGIDITSDGSKLYFDARGHEDSAAIVELDLASRNARRLGRVRGQFTRSLESTALGLSFVSVRHHADLFRRNPSGKLTPVTRGSHVNAVGHCGNDFVVSRFEGERAIVERVDASGRVLRVLGPGPRDFSGACSPDGRTWYYAHWSSGAVLERCDESGCRDLVAGPAAFVAVSPEGNRVAFVEFEKRGPIVKWISAGAGAAREVCETETGCAIGWASAQTLWVSRRRGNKFLWTEVDVDSGRETGKTMPGSRECSDGRADPLSPVDPDLRILEEQTSQLRLIGKEHLARH